VLIIIWGYLGVDVLMILKSMLNKRDLRAWTGLTYLSKVVGGLVYKCDSETLGVLKLDVFLSK
jgi:hypothetical protein